MKLTILTFVAIFCSSMAQVLPHYNGVAIMRDDAAPFLAKITNRINTANIGADQREKEAVEILRHAQDNYRNCEVTFGGNAIMIGSLKGCLGRFTGIAMSQISALEAINRSMVSNDQSLLIRNSNLRLQNMISQHSNKYQSNDSNENLNRRTNEQNRSIKHKSVDSNEESRNFNSRTQKNLKHTNNNSNENSQSSNERKWNFRKPSNKQSNESQENRKNRSSNESH